MDKRAALAERLLARLWRMIQGNQLTHYTDDMSQAKYYEDERYEKDRAAFRDLYREVHDFDPDDACPACNGAGMVYLKDQVGQIACPQCRQ